ncbi:MAG TPA: helix-turn-helix domain-containing protein [Verrucomicrobiae bacterium]|nr:helix-turn-helix domain-containing protein [Verrucomicrobiae bacterium]
MESIGENLREARHHKKVSIEDASRATKIKMEILEQLEADEFDRLAAPTYTKGFLKLYAEYLGLDGPSIVEAYLRSQGGLRRQGLHMETEKAIRARKPRELQLPLRSVGLAVAGLTLAVLVVVVGRSMLSRRGSSTPAAAVVPVSPQAAAAAAIASPPDVPTADFDAYYKPKPKPPMELVETQGK